MNDLLWLIPGAPLAGALFTALLGQKVSAKLCSLLATLMVFVAALMVLLLWFNGGAEANFSQHLYKWMSVGAWQPHISLCVDKVTLVMVTVATWVGFLIHLFSVHFMGKEEGVRRYFFYLNLFIAGMVLFVMADNLVLLYAGWEIMGLCSYALISYYYHKKHNAWCGRKAFVVTRIGDLALAIAIICIFMHFGTVDMADIFNQHKTALQDNFMIEVICLLLLLAGIAKSAQFPLHIWLPDAMTGPATVSALIHAATMVTAGVYLLVRFYQFLESVPNIRLIVEFVGCMTAFYASVVALSQNEVKRILAYSTISQIGYMFIAVGAGAYALALFHLLVHACFKALLFMGSGVIIKACDGVSDIRKMGGLAKSQPLLNVVYLIGSLTLAALPVFTASFYSKDVIIAASYTTDNYGEWLAFLGLAGALFTALYAMRMYFMIFTGQPRTQIVNYKLTFSMQLPLIILAFFSITIGWIQLPEGWHFGPHLLIPWLASAIGWIPLPDEETALWLEILGGSTTIIGIVAAFYMVRSELIKRRGIGNNHFLNNAWYIDHLIHYIIVIPYNNLCLITEIIIEKIFLTKGIVGTLTKLLNFANYSMKQIQAGSLQRYLYIMILGVIVFLSCVII